MDTRFLPTHASFRLLRMALASIVVALIGILPAVFIATPAQAAAGDVTIDADLEDVEGTTFVFEVRRTGGTGLSNLTLYYDTVPVNAEGFRPATVDTDFTRLQGQTTFTASTRDVVKRFYVVGTADTADEFDETFALQFSATQGGPMLYEAYGTLDDDDPVPTYALSAAATPENAGTATITATLSAASGLPIEIPFSTADGTALAGTDYTAVPSGTITVTPGQATGTATVPITNDLVDEVSPESFTVTAGVGTNVLQGTPVTATVDIQDNDGTPSIVSVTNVGIGEAAANNTATFQVSLSNPSYQDITLDVAAIDVETTAAAGGPGSDDYDLVTTSVNIPAGETTAQITATINNDAVYEADETATIRATVPGNMTSRVTGQADGTLTITEDDAIPTVSLNTDTAAEGGNLTVTATTAGVAERTMTYSLTLAGDNTAPNDPTEGGDVTDSGAVATVTGGLSSGTAVPFRTVPVPGDNADENTEVLKVTVHNQTYSTTPDVSSTYQVTDDPNDITPVIVIANLTVDEFDGTASVQATLDFTAPNQDAGTTQKTLSAVYTTVNGSAKSPADFTAPAANTAVTFNPGQTTRPIDIPIIDDGFYETNETFQVALTGSNTVTVTITDDDGSTRPTFSVTAPASTTEGQAGTADFTVTLSDPAAVAVTLQVTVTDVTTSLSNASPGKNDYSAPSTVVIAADETTGTIPVTINNDTAYEPIETATVSVSLGGEPNVQGGPHDATLTITDNDAVPTITLNTATTAEGGNLVVTGTTNGVAERDMAYTLTLAGDTSPGEDPAEAGDYTDSGMGKTITGGTASGNTSTFRTIATTGTDLIDENDEALLVTVHNSTYTTTDVSSSFEITDDPLEVTPVIVVSNLTYTEASGVAAVPVALDFATPAAPANNEATSTEKVLTATYNTANGTAKAPGDYTAVSNGTVTFDNPAVTSKTIGVTVVGDALYETDETFQLALTGGNTATVTITDNDSGAIPGYSVTAAASATEGQAGTADFTVTLDSPAAAEVTLQVTTTGGNALSGGGTPGADDYTVSGTVVIAADETTGTIPVTINGDTAYEGTETVDVVVSVGGETNVTGGPHQGTLTITDDDAIPTITLNTGVTAAEGNNLSVIATTSGVAERNMVYALTLAGDGTGGNDAAEASGDFVDSGATATITGGTASGSQVTLRTFAASGDTVDENTETVRVTAHNNTHASTPDVSSTYQITDDANDITPVIAIGNLTTAETGTAQVPVTLDFASPAAPGVNDATSTEKTLSTGYSTADGTATAPGDYTAIANGTVTFDNPVVTSKTIDVTIVADTVYELNETFTVAFTGPGAPSATVTITDDDSGAKPGYSVTAAVPATEGQAGTADFTVTLDTPAVAQVTLQVGVTDVTTSLSDAGPGQDDYAAPSTVVIAAGQTTGTVSLTIDNDTAYEGTETATVVVSLGGETNVTGGPHQGTLTITDNDAIPTITLNTGVTAAEGNNLSVIATTSGVAERNMSYTLTLAGDGTGGNDAAEASGDFVDSGAPATINGGTASGSQVTLRTFAASGDTVDENTETVKVTAHNGTYSTPDVDSTYQITDDPNDITPVIAIGNLTTAETGTAQVPVTLDFTSPAAPGVNDATSTEKTLSTGYSTADGTAAAPGDYTAIANGTVTFDNPAVTSKTIDVTIAADSVYELDETFTVAFTGPGAPSATVTITDDDSGAKPGYTVSAAVAATEGQAGTADFTVTLDNPAVAQVTLQVAVTDVTTSLSDAVPGQDDYTAPGTVVIPAGGTTSTIALTIDNDTAYEGTETATVVVSLGGETNVTGGPHQGTLTITDNDAIPTITLNTGVTAAEGNNLSVIATTSGVAERNMVYALTLAGDGTGGNDAAEAPADYVDSGATATVNGGTASGSQVTLRTFAANGDTVDENTETVKVTAHNNTYSTPDVDSTYQITDDPNDITPVIAIGNLTTAETGTAQVPVTLDFTSPAAPGVNDATSTEKTLSTGYSTANGTAKAPGDYTAIANGTVTFDNPAVTSKTIDVTIAADSLYETNETFTVAFTGPGAPSATVTITDDDSGTKPGYTVSSAVAATEGQAGTADFTVTLDSAAAAQVTLQVAVTGGNATTGAGTPGTDDYTMASTVVIAADETTATFPVTINNDGAYEGTETATVVVSVGGENNVQGGPHQGTLTITDDEALPTITLNTQTAAEGGSIAVIATPSGLAQRDMSYALTLTGDSSGGNDAADAGDFTDSAVAGTITGGTAANTPVTLRTIPVAADTVDENTETLEVLAHNSTFPSTPDVDSLYQITDDPNDITPVIAIADLTTAETGTAQVPVTLDFASPAAPGVNDATTTEKTLSTGYSTADGTASAPGDYTATASGTVTFDNPAVTSTTIDVPIVADTGYELDETFTVAFTGPGAPSATVTITDDDSGNKPTFSVSPTVSATEGQAGTADFTVTLTAAAVADITLPVSVIDVTTAFGLQSPGGDDYSAPATVTIDAGETTATVPVTINDDDAYEGPESATLRVSLGGTTDAQGGPAEGTLAVADDETVPTVSMNTGAATEGDPLGVIGTTDGVAERTMSYTLTLAGDGTGGRNAAESEDYVDSGATATVTGGTASGTELTFRTIATNADTVDENAESVKVTVHNDTYSTGDVSSYYQINDDANDKPPAVAAGSLVVDEGNGNADVPVTLTFDPVTNGATATERPVVIGYEVLNGTAASNDVGAPVTNPVTIAAGDTSGVIRVPIVNDTRNELNETFQVHLTSVVPAEAVVSADTGTVTITDNDQNFPRPTFSVTSAVSAAEGDGVATFTVTLSGAAQDDVDFTVAAYGLSATDSGGVGDDYDAPAGTLRIALGALSGSITVPIKQDTVFEAAENARISVALATGERDAIGSAQEGTLLIQNDDAPPSVTIGSADAAEGTTIVLSGSVVGVAQRDYVIGELSVAGDSTGGSNPADTGDYSSAVSATIPGGTPSGSQLSLGSIQLANDTIDEPTEALALTLGGRSTRFLITDDPNDVPPALSVGDGRVTESGGSAQLTVATVWRSGTTATEQAIGVPWSTAAGTAKAGKDFTTSAGTATIPALGQSAAIRVPVLDDTQDEPDQTFTVTLGSATSPSGIALDRATATVTVADDDEPSAPTLVQPAAITGSGVVTLSGTAGSGAQVYLFAPTSASDVPILVAATTADVDGNYTFKRTFETGGPVKTRVAGLFSPVRTVQIRQDPTLTGSSTARGVVVLTVTGDPRTAGQAVQLQRAANGTWVNVASGKLGGAGTFTATLRNLPSKASYYYRAVIAATPATGILAGTSNVRQVVVK